MLDPDRERARRYAEAHGYFWEPCPMCGRPFGGHELNFDDYIGTGERTEGVAVLQDGDRVVKVPCRYQESQGVCPDCGPKARRSREALGPPCPN